MPTELETDKSIYAESSQAADAKTTDTSTAETVEQEDAVGVKMSLTSPDGDEGYPGQVDVTVTFLLNNKNQLSIRYFAETNQTTPLSLTNHTYFNLSGFQDTIENLRASIYSEAYLAPDVTIVPVGEVAAVE